MSSERVRVLFCGDYAPVRRYEHMAVSQDADVFGDLRDDIASADISFLNLECALSVAGTPIKKMGPHFRAHPDCARSVAGAGFDVVGMANNHVMDYGPEALVNTIESCRRHGLYHVGAGTTLKEAQRPLVVQRAGLRVSIVAVAERYFGTAGDDTPGVAPLDAIDTVYQIQEAKKHADMVFVTIHGGNEFIAYPPPGLRRLCRFFIDQGACAVICHHPHVPGAFEAYGGRPIVYSLGNLLFDRQDLLNPRYRARERWEEGYAFVVEVGSGGDPNVSWKVIPYTQRYEQGGIRKMMAGDKDRFLDYLEEINAGVRDDGSYRRQWHSYCAERSTPAVMRHLSPWSFTIWHRTGVVVGLLLSASPVMKRRWGRMWSAVGEKIKNWLIRGGKFLPALKILRCDSSREVLVVVLEDAYKSLR